MRNALLVFPSKRCELRGGNSGNLKHGNHETATYAGVSERLEPRYCSVTVSPFQRVMFR